jgi:asparagine synthase (glutamine-hydrolysing)
MCGIAGIVDRRGRQNRLVSRMLQTIAHRGPDGAGVTVRETANGTAVTLGHRRLSILDLSDAAAQPMADTTTQFAITFNGEIYNYLEIRAELMRAGVAFRSTSDTEVILEAYKAWGPACLSRFNGMFAFALYDAKRGVLFCARDRYGEKPFLYSVGPDYFAFASEYKALLRNPQIPAEIDEWRLLRAAHNASTGLDADPETVFTAIRQLQHGEAMEVDVRTLTVRTWRYWQLQPTALREGAKDADVFDEFRELLIDAVRLRLRSDVPVGSCLSGGLDSSAIVCIARHLVGDDQPYHTFTGCFPGTPADESAFAREVVSATGSLSHTVEPTVDRFMDDLPSFMWHNELPVGSSSQFAQWCVFRLAKEQEITVLLDGQGADEGLGGYEQYFTRYIESLAERGDRARLDRELPMIRRRYPGVLTPASRAWRDQLSLSCRHWLSNQFNQGSSLLYGLRLSVGRRLAEENALPRRAGFNALSNALAHDSFGRFLTSLLRYGDRNAMAHSREVRLPFCDHRLAEFVFSLPPHLLMGDAQTKRLLRESMTGILPERIRTRWRKQGFRPPQDQWFESAAFLSYVQDTLRSVRFRESPYWIPGWWDKAMDRIRRGDASLGWVVWQPFIVEQWRTHFLDRFRAEAVISAATEVVSVR